MKADGFKWWKKRLKRSLERYDLLRIDHFRGLDRFWAIPFGESAKTGEWVKAYGEEILNSVNKSRLIAEDLGVIDDGVINLLKATGLPGMKVLLFAFDGNPSNPYLPKNITKNSVAYVGTHDNNTAYGYAKSLSDSDFKAFASKINEVLPKGAKRVKGKKQVAPALIETALSTEAELCIISFADLVGLDDKYRINTPATVGNWTTRFKKEHFTEELSENLLALTKKYKR
jgi:4-alpha-glucanotransferase